MRLLCVHQGYELYGSDRSFISAVAALRRRFPDADIETKIPAEGPIVPFLTRHSSRVIIEPLWILRRRRLARILTKGLLIFPLSFARAVRNIRKRDLVYINTLTVLDYLLAAMFFRRKSLLHVREIPTGFGGYAIRFLVRLARVPTIFNSLATRDAFSPTRRVPSYVLYNGYDGPACFEVPRYSQDRRLRILMLGRINSWKGQDLLIEACSNLPPSIKMALDVRIVGGSFESNIELEQSLHSLVERGGCNDCVFFEPFTSEPAKWYEWCDLVVVPSRLPEPFGRVPIEAMSFARGAVVAAFGGLVETVQHGVTGWHVTPNDPQALAQALGRAALEPRWVALFGRNARSCYEANFRQEIVDAKFLAIIQERLASAHSWMTARQS